MIVALLLCLQDPAELIRGLADDSSAVRDRSERELMKMGTKVEAAVRAEMERSKDFEVRERSKRILRTLPFVDVLGADLGRKFGVAEEGWARFHVLAEHRDSTPPLDEKSAAIVADGILAGIDGTKEMRDLAHYIGDRKVKACGAVLLRLLKEDDARLRCDALLAVHELNLPEHEPAVELLLKDKELEVRKLAVIALGRVGSSNQKFVDLAGDPEPAIREAAIRVLGDRNARACAEVVAKALDDSDATVIDRAVSVLIRLEAKDQSAKLAALLTHRDAWLRARAIEAIGRLEARDHEKAIEERLADDSADVREWAARTLIGFWKKEPDRTAGLLKHKDPRVRQLATAALGADRAADLVARLADDEPAVRGSALERIRELALKDCARDVEKKLDDPDPEVRWKAARALGELWEPSQVVKLLAHGDGSVRLFAAQSLARHNEHLKEVALLLQDKEPRVRRDVIQILQDAGAKDFSAGLAPLLDDEDTCFAAATALRKLWGKNDAANMVALLALKTPFGRKTGIDLLVRAGAVDRAEEIAKLLKDPDEEVRVAAAEALGKLDARACVEAIKMALQRETSDEVRDALSHSLKLLTR